MEEGEPEDQRGRCPWCDLSFIRAYQNHFHLRLLSKWIYRVFFSDGVLGHFCDVIITDSAFRPTISTKDLSSHQAPAQNEILVHSKDMLYYCSNSSRQRGLCAVKISVHMECEKDGVFPLRMTVACVLVRKRVLSTCQTGSWRKLFYTEDHAFQLYFDPHVRRWMGQVS